MSRDFAGDETRTDILNAVLADFSIEAATVALALKRQGITDVRPLAGGLEGWLQRGYPVVSSAR